MAPVTAPEATPPVPDAAVVSRGKLRLPRSPKLLIGIGLLGAFILLAIIGPLVAPFNPSVSLSTTNGVPQAPSAAHWLGTTQVQQDVFSQLLVGGRSTILVAFVAGIVATVLSIILGVTAGYLGGLADDLLSMLANIFLVLPALPLLIVVFGFLPRTGGSNDLLIGLIIAFTGWAWGARVLRAQTLSLRERDYVMSAQIIGERTWRIIAYEILPNLLPIVASSFLFTVLYGVGTYTALAFLGLVNTEHWSWGAILFWAQASSAENSGFWWWYIPAGLAVALFGTSLALLNFGIDEFINPRLREAGLTRKAAKRAGIPVRSKLGMTPVVRQTTASVAAATTGQGMPEPVLEIRGLCVDYGYGEEAVHAVVDCNLVLRRGQVLGLAGESGSGKTTMAMAAIRLLRSPAVITSGQVLFHSKPVSGDGPTGTIDMLAPDEEELRSVRWSEIAVVLQSSLNAMNPVITIGSQFDDLLRVHRPHLSNQARQKRAAELLDMVGINADRLRSYPHELSGGMRQRAMIAMALALAPQVMILDEPTTALDVVTQREILEELMGLRDRLGFACLFITHDLSLLVEFADEIAVMYAGRLMERAPAGALFHAPRLPYTHGLLHCFPPLH
nr:dipeptide/oligopeptide/nickel ABC transporter permease/ATP-binding protein [Actinomycetota bacterium]